MRHQFYPRDKLIPTSAIFRANNQDIYSQLGDLQVDASECLDNSERQAIGGKLSLLSENVANQGGNLSKIITDIDNLHIKEMRKYEIANYQLQCVQPQTSSLVLLDHKIAFFYSLIVEKKTAIIARFPGNYEKLHWVNLDQDTLREEVNKLRRGLENYGDIIYNPQLAQKFYDLIIRPFVNDLESLHIKTLVFIPDGILRTVPMAALHDGEKFLIEKYAIATTPNLSLTNLQLSIKKLRALVVGLTKEAKVDGCECQPLTHVAAEIRQVQHHIPDSKQLLDENFTSDRLESELHQSYYPIIHIATHGAFGKPADDPYFVTGHNQKLTITKLKRIFRNLNQEHKTIDLLMMTACESAVGKDNAVFGLAGVGVQAGVRTVIASLWSINDATTVDLVNKFYEAWSHPNINKAEALRTAQRSLIASNGPASHPAYWAAFILVGSWL